MKILKDRKGISLIVLVITIIVMIILATAIILSLSNSGIIGKANKAKTDTERATILEVINIINSENMLNGKETSLEETINKLENQGIKTSKVTDTTPKVTAIHINGLNFEMHKNEMIEITVSILEEAQSLTRYYVFIENEAYELIDTGNGIILADTSSIIGEAPKVEVSGAEHVSVSINQENKIITITSKETVGTDNLTIKYGGKSVSTRVKILDIIKFTVNGKEYEAERGMTWKDFLDSIYNVDDFYYHHWDTPIAIIYDETNLQAINAGYNDEIIENTEYNIYKYRPNPS